MKGFSITGIICLGLSAILGSSCKQKANEPEEASATLYLDKERMELKPGEEASLTANFNPASYKAEIKWISKDNTIAAVSPDGRVKALKAGNTIVIASSGNLSDQCLVTVIDPDNPDGDSKSVSVEIKHNIPSGHHMTLQLASLSGKVLIGLGNATPQEYNVSANASEPRMVEITVQNAPVRIYESPITCLNLDGNSNISELILADVEQLQILSAADNKLKAVNLSKAKNLIVLNLMRNELTGAFTIDLPKLKILDISNNAITELSLAAKELASLNVSSMALSELPLNGFPLLKKITADHNRLNTPALKSTIANLPRLGKPEGYFVILDSKNAAPEGNIIDTDELVSAAGKQGWILYDGSTPLNVSDPGKEDPAGFDAAIHPYINWADGNRNSVEAWEKANNGVFNPDKSDTEDPDDMTLYFEVKDNRIMHRIYFIEAGNLLQTEVYISPLSLLMLPGEGAKFRLNSNFEDSLLKNGYAKPEESFNTFSTSNENLKCNLVISREAAGGSDFFGQLRYSPK